MSTLKARLESDLRSAMKARDELVTSTLRMALTAVRAAEVAGAAARELSDDELLGVLTKEAKKRREAATAFGDAGRTEMAAKNALRRTCSAGTCRRSSPTPSWPTVSRRRYVASSPPEPSRSWTTSGVQDRDAVRSRDLGTARGEGDR
jgi:hypothetical protein